MSNQAPTRHPADLAWRTWPEAAELFSSDPVALLPTGATEPHGPHLPLDVDVTISTAQARRAAEKLIERGVPAFVLPAMAYGVTFFTEGFPGRVTFRPGTLWAAIEDIATSLAEQGVRRIAICNAHLEPDQVKVLRGVIKDHTSVEGGAHVIFPDHTRRRLAERLGDEFKSGEAHAGRYESSIALAVDPETVREEERAALPAVDLGLVEGMLAGAKSFKELGSEQAYCGSPAEATAPEGTDLIERLSDMVVEAALEAWPQRFEQG